MVLAIALMACDTSTDIENVTATGTWDGVGAMQATFSGVRMDLNEAADGTITGTWRRGGSAAAVTGVNQAGNVELTLHGFEAGTVDFDGRFTNRYRMEGTLNGTALPGPAVFRRTSF